MVGSRPRRIWVGGLGLGPCQGPIGSYIHADYCGIKEKPLGHDGSSCSRTGIPFMKLSALAFERASKYISTNETLEACHAM